MKDIKTLKFSGNWEELQDKIYSHRQSRTTFAKQCQEIKRNRT